MTGLVGKLGREDGQAKAAEEAELVIGVGAAVVRVLAGKVVKGDNPHGISNGGKIGADTDTDRGGGGGGKEAVVDFLEAAVDVAAEAGMSEGAIGEIRERRRGGRIGKVILKEGGTSRTEQSALTTGEGLPDKKDGLVGRRKVSNAAGGVSNAMGAGSSKEGEACVRNNRGAGGGQNDAHIITGNTSVCATIDKRCMRMAVSVHVIHEIIRINTWHRLTNLPMRMAVPVHAIHETIRINSLHQLTTLP
jgi:hypothetical protein